MVRVCAIVALCALISCAGAVNTTSKFLPRKRKIDKFFNILTNRTKILPASSAISNMKEEVPEKQAEVDAMVNNLLQWIQGIYQQNSNRKVRQYFGGKPEKPRPFEPAHSYLPPVTGYPPAGPRPMQSFNEGPSSANLPQLPTPIYKPNAPTYQPNIPMYQPESPFKPSQTEEAPFQSSLLPSPPTQSYLPPQPPFESNPSTPTYPPSQPTYQPSQPPYQPSQPSYQASQTTYQPSQPTYPTSQQTYPSSEQTYQPPRPSFQPDETTQSADIPPAGSIGSTASSSSGSFASGSESTETQTTIGGDVETPPHVHDIKVNCGKSMMTINIEFDKPYNGLVYSQDHYNDADCIYVKENSNTARYSFTVSLNKCGTKFYSDFENEGKAYLENVLVLQNEVGIQEEWDHIRRVRCLWEGNLKKQLITSLSVGMLNQVTSNFSGDTAMARLDIQTGRGPFAPEADGLIKIGETMTLVVSVTGDAGFDILVRECVARDADRTHAVPLTDNNGCVLRPKIFGAFQKTRETGNTGASIITYAFFKAFKFPDEMNLIIQCEVELCKTDCDVCPNPGSYEPKRKRRDIIHIGNRTVEPSTTIAKGIRVVLAEDLPAPAGLCISSAAAIWGGTLVFFGSLLTSIIVSYCWQRSRGSIKFS